MNSLIKEIINIYKDGEETVLVTLCSTQGSTPRKPGAKMLVYPNGRTSGTIGGGELEFVIIQKALEVMKKGESVFWESPLKDVGMICGGVAAIYLEYLGGHEKQRN